MRCKDTEKCIPFFVLYMGYLSPSFLSSKTGKRHEIMSRLTDGKIPLVHFKGMTVSGMQLSGKLELSVK